VKSQDLAQLKLPDVPGVYKFQDVDGNVLYVGKATSLCDRVRSYFGADLIATRGPRLVDMVTRAVTVTYEETPSVLEALLLESVLIKRLKPLYNVREKDDRSYMYVVFTDDAWPLVLSVRGRLIDKKRKVVLGDDLQTVRHKFTKVFGPFPNPSALREALRMLRRLFPFDDRASRSAYAARFYQQLGLSPDATQTDAGNAYKRNLAYLSAMLSGKGKTVRAELKKRMMELANKEKFEEAAVVRKQLFSLDHLRDVSLIKRDFDADAGGTRIEAYDVAHLQGRSMIGVMTVIQDGEAMKAGYRTFNIKSVSTANDPAALTEVLRRRLKHVGWGMPGLIVVDGNQVQLNAALTVLGEMNLSIPVVAVTKDERHKARAIIGDAGLISKYKTDIILANSEAHRFSITRHREKERTTLTGPRKRK
jgi:excinuclease UvrABC nuclease subunit